MSSSTVFRGLVSRAVPADELERQPAPEQLLPPVSDDALMRSVQSGDQQALGMLFDRYSRLVLSVGLRILRDTSEAQDLLQDVFLYIFKKAASFDPARGSTRSWLVQVAYSRAFDRRDYLVVRRFYDYCHIDEVIDSVASGFCPEALGLASEMTELLQQALAALNERQRETLRLFFFEGYSLKEISARLDESLGNTRNHYYRGLESLRQIMRLSPKSGKDGRE